MSCEDNWTSGPLKKREYLNLKATIERTCKYISGEDVTNMTGYLNALTEVLTPVSHLDCYPVNDLLMAIEQMRKFDETRSELLKMCYEFLEALDICMHPFEG